MGVARGVVNSSDQRKTAPDVSDYLTECRLAGKWCGLTASSPLRSGITAERSRQAGLANSALQGISGQRFTIMVIEQPGSRLTDSGQFPRGYYNGRVIR